MCVEGARSTCLPAGPPGPRLAWPHPTARGTVQDTPQVGSEGRGLGPSCVQLHRAPVRALRRRGPSRLTAPGSGVCLQDRLCQRVPGLQLPAVAADGGRRLGGGLRVLRAAALRAECQVPGPQHVLGADGAHGRQVGAGEDGGRPGPDCRAGGARPRGSCGAPSPQHGEGRERPRGPG